MQGKNTNTALQQLQLEERQKGGATVEVSGGSSRPAGWLVLLHVCWVYEPFRGGGGGGGAGHRDHVRETKTGETHVQTQTGQRSQQRVEKKVPPELQQFWNQQLAHTGDIPSSRPCVSQQPPPEVLATPEALTKARLTWGVGVGALGQGGGGTGRGSPKAPGAENRA